MCSLMVVIVEQGKRKDEEGEAGQCGRDDKKFWDWNELVEFAPRRRNRASTSRSSSNNNNLVTPGSLPS